MTLATLRPDLQVSRLGQQAGYVVKDPQTRQFFQLGEQEHFLLTRLDGRQTPDAIRHGFCERFGESLSADDLQGFLELARSRGMLQPVPGAGPAGERGFPPRLGDGGPTAPVDGWFARWRSRQSLFRWRFSFFDPDRLFSWLAPRLWFFWTRTFLFASAGLIAVAALLVWVNRQELVSSFADALSWRTALLAWLTLLTMTTCHEFAHGLTCKRHGGEVHEIGFLLMFLLPGFYCNVSDAWLIPEKSKRLWVTLAGCYCELVLWSAAVFVWRLSTPDGLVNHLAWIVVTVSGVRVLFNCNPLMKLDGYYLLSDWLEIPNLRQRAVDLLTGHVRRVLWGAPRPPAGPRDRVLLGFGTLCWLFSMVFLGLMLTGLGRALDRWLGPLGVCLAIGLGAWLMRGLFRGLCGGEVRIMLFKRHWRTACWLAALSAAAAALALIQIDDLAGGTFQVHAATRTEVRARVAGFLETVHVEEGDRVSTGQIVARLGVPDLASRLAQQRAEVQEACARLRLLEIGPRPEELAEQRARVERATRRVEQARQHLDRAKTALQEDLQRLQQQVAADRAALALARQVDARVEQLVRQRARSSEERDQTRADVQIAESKRQQSEAAARAREAQGCLEAEADLAKWQMELSEATGALNLLEAGSRPEEIEAQQAHLLRAEQELRYLSDIQSRLTIRCPLEGLVSTPGLQQRVGRYLAEGELICIVESRSAREIRIAVPEDDSLRIREGQSVVLKLRALPFDRLTARVERLSPVTADLQGLETSPATAPAIPARGSIPGTIVVHCRLNRPAAELRPGLTGYARISTGRRCLGALLLDRVVRIVRTEFWW